ncbi:hypothetical protein A5881_002326 [Enterococcus termitis]|nr:hypothetical protein A5881_001356 [Enterococcus termitis]
MYYFFEKHKILGALVDIVLMCFLTIGITYLFYPVDFTRSWFIPVFSNIFILCMFFYVNRVHEPPKKRLKLLDWLNIIRWLNSIGLILHTTIGYYTKYSHKQVIKPIWNQSKEMIALTISIYLFLIIFSNVMIFWRKNMIKKVNSKKKKR